MSKVVLCFGEVLIDVYDDCSMIGGAPFNVALNLKKLGVNSNIITRVGNDDFGKEVYDLIRESGFNTFLIQKDIKYETGKVLVSLDKKGIAKYEIKGPAAWDKIEIEKYLVKAIEQADVFVFGSLIAREEISYKTLRKFISHANLKVFDVNLRKPHYSYAVIKHLMVKADLIKFNRDELLEISSNLGFENSSIKKNIMFISKLTNTSNICVTLGEDGAVLYTKGRFFKSDGFVVKVHDTVGSGDAFLAMLIEGIISNKSPAEYLKRACGLGALIASKPTANTSFTLQELNVILKL
jgi:fructokinase